MKRLTILSLVAFSSILGAACTPPEPQVDPGKEIGERVTPGERYDNKDAFLPGQEIPHDAPGQPGYGAKPTPDIGSGAHPSREQGEGEPVRQSDAGTGSSSEGVGGTGTTGSGAGTPTR